MKNKNSHINLDDALNHLIQNYEENGAGDYAQFLEKLSNFENTHIDLDNALQQKLSYVTLASENQYKKIIYLYWFRLVKKTALLALVLFVAGLGAWYFLKNENMPVRQISQQKNQQKTAIAKDNHLKNDFKKNPNLNLDKPFLTNKFDKKQKVDFEKTAVLKNNPKPFNAIIKQGDEIRGSGHTSITSSSLDTSINQRADRILPFNFLSKKLTPLYELQGYNVAINYLANIKTDVKNNYRFSFGKNYSFGLISTASLQQFHTEFASFDKDSLNRNYQALSQNGVKKSAVFNYGFFFEKALYKGIGFSLGLERTSVILKQQTNFALNEVQVIDLNGKIAGYLDIPEVKRISNIENNVNYINIPLKIFYQLEIYKKINVRANFGASLLKSSAGNYEKFDMQTLKLNSFSNTSSRFGVNNLSYGLQINRDIYNNISLGFGYNYSSIKKIKGLSNNIETVSAKLNNFTINLTYKL